MARGPTGREKGVFFEQSRSGRLNDPYIPKKGWPDPTVCPTCHAVYQKKHWVFDEGALKAVRKLGANVAKCPACRKIEDRYPMGVITISGDFTSEHREEIVNLIRNEERRAMEKNPLERIITLEHRDGGLYVETTSDALALIVGRILCRAYKGKSDYHFRYGDKYVTVEWKREG